MSRLLNLKNCVYNLTLKKRIQAASERIICAEDPGSYNQAVMELGQRICRPQQPLCGLCPVSQYCAAYQNNTVNLIHIKKIKKEIQAIETRMIIPVLKSGLHIGLTHRSKKAKFLKSILGFPTQFKVDDNLWICDDGSRADASEIPKLKLRGFFKHSITHYKIKCFVYSVLVEQSEGEPLHFKPRDKIAGTLVSNFDRKAWKVFQNDG
jgi:A/G-specific adenine glycosylase